MARRRTVPSSWAGAVRSHPQIRLRVKVSPGSARNRVMGVHDRYLKVAVTAPPQRGKANRMVEKLLSAEAGMRARVVSGHTSPFKEVHLQTRRDNL